MYACATEHVDKKKPAAANSGLEIKLKILNIMSKYTVQSVPNTSSTFDVQAPDASQRNRFTSFDDFKAFIRGAFISGVVLTLNYLMFVWSFILTSNVLMVGM